MDQISVYVSILIYLGVGSAIAFFSKKYLKKDFKDFYTASGRFGTLLATLSYAATTYSAFMFIGLVGLAYTTGVGALGFELVYFVGTLLLLYFIAPRYWNLHKRYGYVSPAEILSARYGGREVGAAVTVLALISLIPYASSQVIGVAMAAEGASGGAIPYVPAVIIAIIVALIWSLIAGMWSVGWTDVFQGLIMLFTGFLMVLWVYSWGYEGRGFDFTSLGSLSYVPNPYWSFSTFLNMTIPWFFFAVTNPQVVQRLFSPKDSKTLKSMIIWFGAYGLLFTVLVTLLGLMLRGLTVNGLFPLVSYRDSVTPTLLGMAPLWIGVFGIVAVLAASVSTIDGILLTLSSMAARDIYESYRPGSTRLKLLVGRATLGVLALACTAFALARPGFIVDLAVLSSSLLLPQAPIVLGMFVWKRGGRASAILTLISGFSVAIALYFTKMTPLGLPMNAWTIIVSTVVYTLTASFERGPEGIEVFLGVGGEEV
ncbi:MAG: sodium:solute symporter family protein [Candidatus Methanomethyliaceae archaeon]|nr:sodium:solute symporter family protein [Candidatus Methanomethyliaceae archaeon]